MRLLGYPAERLADYERWGYVPLLGPWAKLVLAPPHVDDAGATLFVIEGLLEFGGLVMAVVSLFVHPEETWSRPTQPGVQVSLTRGGGALVARF